MSSSVHMTHAEALLNSSSGFKAICGTSDFSTILDKAKSGDESCKLCLDMFLDRIVMYIGGYCIKLGGIQNLDAIVFSGGIGESSADFRRMVVEALVPAYGKDALSIDNGKNKNSGIDVVCDIGSDDGKLKVLVCKTDEEVS